MPSKSVPCYAAATQKNRRRPALPVLITLIVFSALFFSGIAHAQPSTDASAFRLIGTMRSGEFTGAVLADSKGEQTFYRLNKNLPDGSQIIGVHNDRILLRRTDGSQYELFIAHDKMTAVTQPEATVNASHAVPVIAPSGPAHNEPRPASPRKQRRVRHTSEEGEE